LILRNENEKRILVITHIDLDGFGCALLFKYFEYPFTNMIMSDYSEYEGRHNTFDYSMLSFYDEIIYADFSPDQKSMKIIEENNIKCIILDHHIGQEDEFINWDYINKEYYFDDNKCGAEITFQWLKNKTSPRRYPKHLIELLNYIYHADLWLKDTEEFVIGRDINTVVFKQANYACDGLAKHEKYINVMINKIKNFPDHFYFSPTEKNIIKKNKEEIKKVFIKACSEIMARKDGKGYWFGIVKMSSKISDVASMLLEKYYRFDYIIIINDYRPEKLNISLRSREGFNLLQLKNAAGHEMAAGMNNIDNKFIEDLWSEKIYCLEYEDES
jgi:oligoribonuclease NrnB/cAMP/cGMP phosphodiesterase (DHH superfamily)